MRAKSLISGKMLKEVRALQGLSQEALADKSGVSAPTIKRIERKEEASGHNALTLDRLATALNVGPEDLAEYHPLSMIDIRGDLELYLENDTDANEFREAMEKKAKLIELRQRVLGAKANGKD